MQRGLLLGFFTFIAFISAIIVVFSVFISHGNEIGNLFKYLLVLSFFIGLLSPKPSFSLLLVLCLVIDLCKRMMVVSGRISSMDLYYVLGIPPVLVTGIAVSALIGIAQGRLQFRLQHLLLMAASALIILFSLFTNARELGFSPGVLFPVLANQGIYTLLLFLVPLYFQDRSEIVALLRKLIWLCIPIAIYGVVQKIWGYQEFEIAYLKTGYTMEIKQLESGEIRPFSSLNSPTSYGALCATMAAFSIVFMFIRKNYHNTEKILSPYIALPSLLIFLTGLIASTSRTSSAIFPIILAGFFCFVSKKRTIGLYSTLISAFIALWIFAPLLLQNLMPLQAMITDVVGQDNFLAQITVVGTYTDRLQGFINLTRNPKVYTLFGHGTQTDLANTDDLFSHDALTSSIITYGIIPVLCILIPAIFATAKAHIVIYNIKDTLNRNIAATCVAAGLSYAIISLIGGSVFNVFPINAFLWLFLGITALMATPSSSSPATEPTTPSPHSKPPHPTPLPPRKIIHHFTKSGSQQF